MRPDPAALEFAPRVASITAIAAAIRAKIAPDPTDISAIMGDIGALLDSSITGVAIREAGPPPLDLSRIDREALARRFRESKHRNTELEVLKAAIRATLTDMIAVNPTRIDFAEMFETLIEEYNVGSRSIEELFAELVKLSRSLSDEQERHVRENLTEEELVIFDILTRPAPDLSPDERAEIRKVAHDLLPRVKALLELNWREKVRARSRVQEAIDELLDSGLPTSYTRELFDQKRAAVFQHVYESYAA